MRPAIDELRPVARVMRLLARSMLFGSSSGAGRERAAASLTSSIISAGGCPAVSGAMQLEEV